MSWLEPSRLVVVCAAVVVLGNLCWALVARPQRGVLLLAALVPFDGLLLVVPVGDSLAPWKEALVLAVLLATFFAPASARAQVTGRAPGWVPAAIGLVALGLASAAVVGGLVGLWGAKITFFYVLLAVVLWRCPLDRVERDRLVTILMATGLVTALVGLAQQLVGPTRLNDLGYAYNDVIRFSGGFFRSFSTFTQPFSFGLFLTLVLLVCLPVAMSDPRRPRNTVFLAVVPILVLGMATSLVRGAFLGLLAGLVFLCAWRYRGLVHALVPTGLVVLLPPSTVLAAFLSSTSLQERGTGWSVALERVLEAPLGHGLGTTGAAAEKALELGAPLRDVIVVDGRSYQPDNQFVKIALELGPLGLWLLILLLAAAVTGAMAVARESRRSDRALAEGVAASVVAAAAAGLVSTYLEIFPLDLYFWLLLGVLLSCDRSSTSTLSASDPEEVGSRPTSVS